MRKFQINPGIKVNKPPTPKFKNQIFKQTSPIIYKTKPKRNVTPSHRTNKFLLERRATSNIRDRSRGSRPNEIRASDKSIDNSRLYYMRSQTPTKSYRNSNNPNSNMFSNKKRTVSPNPLKIFNDNLERSQLSRNQSEFDSMLSNIRPSRPNSNRSFKYRSEYDPYKIPRKSILKKTSVSQSNSIGINLGSTWEQFNNVNDSIRGNSFSINGKDPRGNNRFHLQMKPEKGNIKQARWIENSNITKVSEKKRVTIKQKPKVIYVENWKILNVDMSKEGKLYNRFNNGKRPGDETCRVF
jgi:hypothetical protein